jgi:hypothetical protein
VAAVDLAQAEKHQRWKHQSATSSVQRAGAFQSVQGDDASAAASSVRSEGVAQSVMGDECGASASAAQSVGRLHPKHRTEDEIAVILAVDESAAQSVKESMSSGLPAPSPTKHGCLGGGGGLATAHRRVPLRHVICSFCRCLLESFARWRLSDSLVGSGCPGPSPGHPGCNLGDPSARAFTRSGLTCPRSGFDYLSLRV